MGEAKAETAIVNKNIIIITAVQNNSFKAYGSLSLQNKLSMYQYIYLFTIIFVKFYCSASAADFSRVQVARGFAAEGVPKKSKTFWGRDIKPMPNVLQY
jgi:hypothetical protein